MKFSPLGRDLIGTGAKISLTCLFLSFFTDKASFQNCLWGPLKTSSILFGVGGFFGTQNSGYKTTDLT